MRQRRRQAGLAVAALLAVALAFRAAPLYWSAYPSTLDGFGHAARAQTMVATGTIPLTGRADQLFFSTLLATVGLVVDADPLRVTQPVATAVGAGICLFGVAIARQVVTESDISVNPSFVGIAAAGLLAIEGLFLRRTSVPDEDIVGLLFVILVAVALHYAYRTGQLRWYGITGIVLGFFPLLHTFTSFIVALVITGLTARHVSRNLSARSLVSGLVIAGGFWGWIAAYYWTAATLLPFVIPYVDRVTAYPGLFVAWVIVLVVGVVWVQRTGRRIRQTVYVGVVGIFFTIVVLNAFTSVFPGTASTPQVVLTLVSLLLLLALSAAPSLDIIGEYHSGALLVALFGAPAVIIGFSLTASLTAEYFATAMRAQTFLHLPVVVVGAVTLVRLLKTGGRTRVRRAARVVVAIVVVVATIATAPLAVMNMDTASVPSTTLESEYEGVAFASTQHDQWATDHSLSRVGQLSFAANATLGPVASWLSGGPAPRCPVVSQRSWTTTGAHLFPSGPETVPSATYDQWLSSRNVVYTANGLDPVVVSQPMNETGGC